jgi:hypothetical protein
MRNRRGRLALLLVLGIASFSLVSYGQEEKKKPEHYTAVAVGTGGSVGARSLQFDVRISKYASEEEIQELAALLKAKGEDGLHRELEDRDVGRINPVGSTGNQIALARKRVQGSQTIVTAVTARTMSFLENWSGGRSTQYRFGILRLVLDEKGQGTGQVIGAARIKFDKKKGQYEIESYGNQYVKIANVRMYK